MIPISLGKSGRKLIVSAQISAELIRHRALSAPAIATKALIARAVWAIDPPSFLMLGMHEQRMHRWKDHLGYRNGLEPVLRLINWHGEGRRLTVDKLITAERLKKVEIPAAPLIAVIGRDGTSHRHEGHYPQWSTVNEIAEALSSCPDRLFVKPATGWRGNGIFGPVRRNGRWDVEGTLSSNRELADYLLRAARQRACSFRKGSAVTVT